ncbi:MAG: TatD family hydrolase [Oscillospiraceae bacterium]|nr:TatD family hydrolase [Oscillospiraceae bacterium]
MVLIDTHCHLVTDDFDYDRQEVISRMIAKGVSRAVVICCDEDESRLGARLRDENPGFRLACGIHPQDLEYDCTSERLARFRDAVERYKADMIGEIGLDYYSHPHTKEAQKRFFKAQLDLASELGLPVDIHSRKAAADTYETLKRYDLRGIIHSYSGSVEMARLYVKLGYYISFGASMMFPGSRKPAQVIADIPLERLFIETDAPYQSPVRDHRHEPADIVDIYEAICEIRGIGMEELALRLEKNWDELFGC